MNLRELGRNSAPLLYFSLHPSIKLSLTCSGSTNIGTECERIHSVDVDDSYSNQRSNRRRKYRRTLYQERNPGSKEYGNIPRIKGIDIKFTTLAVYSSNQIVNITEYENIMYRGMQWRIQDCSDERRLQDLFA